MLAPEKDKINRKKTNTIAKVLFSTTLFLHSFPQEQSRTSEKVNPKKAEMISDYPEVRTETIDRRRFLRLGSRRKRVRASSDGFLLYEELRDMVYTSHGSTFVVERPI